MPIYWALLTYVLLKPVGEHKDYWFLFQGIDKVVHFFTFLILGFLFKVAYYKISFSYFFMIMLSYALLTEILQDEMNYGRSLDVLDLFADTVGVLIGYLMAIAVLRDKK
ncbi:VanZ family protein [Riemerella anatipestifer]|nr:VanZ family protein [Riemerella anatipestifer]